MLSELRVSEFSWNWLDKGSEVGIIKVREGGMEYPAFIQCPSPPEQYSS
jgi:hypothetical protein